MLSRHFPTVSANGEPSPPKGTGGESEHFLKEVVYHSPERTTWDTGVFLDSDSNCATANQVINRSHGQFRIGDLKWKQIDLPPILISGWSCQSNSQDFLSASWSNKETTAAQSFMLGAPSFASQTTSRFETSKYFRRCALFALAHDVLCTILYLAAGALKRLIGWAMACRLVPGGFAIQTHISSCATAS